MARTVYNESNSQSQKPPVDPQQQARIKALKEAMGGTTEDSDTSPKTAPEQTPIEVEEKSLDDIKSEPESKKTEPKKRGRKKKLSEDGTPIESKTISIVFDLETYNLIDALVPVLYDSLNDFVREAVNEKIEPRRAEFEEIYHEKKEAQKRIEAIREKYKK